MFYQIPVDNSVESLANLIRADLLAREVIPAAENLIYDQGAPGAKNTPGVNTFPKVYFRLAEDFSIDVAQVGDPTPMRLTAIVDGQEIDGGVSIAVEKMRAVVTCLAKDPEGSTTPIASRSRTAGVTSALAGMQLRHRVLAAISRACAGSYRVISAKNIKPLGNEFAYGNASVMVIEFYYHVADDAYATNVADLSTGTQDGEGQTVAEVQAP